VIGGSFWGEERDEVRVAAGRDEDRIARHGELDGHADLSHRRGRSAIAGHVITGGRDMDERPRGGRVVARRGVRAEEVRWDVGVDEVDACGVEANAAAGGGQGQSPHDVRGQPPATLAPVYPRRG
jgi:hypothetical protein